MELEPRPEILLVPPAIHGALDFAVLRRHGLAPNDVIDFSANTNPYGPSPHVHEAIARLRVDAYPDREALELRETLARYLDVETTEILAGSGASELIWLIALAFVRPGDRVLILGPTYGEYARVSILMGAAVTTCVGDESMGSLPHVAPISRHLSRSGPRLTFICNPNNPTGSTIASDTILSWAREYRRTLFVVDEAYLAFAPALCSAAGPREPNVLVVRSMTKDYGLAGLRLGYAVGHAGIIAALKRVQPPWSVSASAQAAGVAALHDQAHLVRSLKVIGQTTAELREGFAELGLVPLPSATHFFLLHVGDGAAFRGALLNFGIVVRDCASFGLPEYVRIAARRPDENARLLRAVEEIVGRHTNRVVARARDGKPRAGRVG